MLTITAQLDRIFRDAITAAFDLEVDPQLGVSQNEKFGDYQSNAAMGLARLLAEKTGKKTNPREVAEQIKAKLNLGEMAEEVSIAGPGFINVKLSASWLTGQLTAIAADTRLGIPLRSHPHTVVVDYSGPNVAKEMHVGHLRSTIIGDAISRVLEFLGDKVIRQNHIGDWGTQFGMLIAYLMEDEGYSAANVRLADLEDFYRHAKKRFDDDPSFQDRARQAVVRLQSGGTSELQAWRTIVQETRRHYQPIYERLNILLKLEDERGESFYNPMLPAVVKELRDNGMAVESTEPVEEPAEEIDAIKPTDIREDRRIVVFAEGHKNPLVIQKSDGGYLYGTTDLAAIRFRVSELHANRIIYTHDSRQSQHFALVFAVAKKAHWADDVSLEFAPFGTMLGEDGKPFKTRTGGTVKLKDLLDEAQDRALAIIAVKNPELSTAQQRTIAGAVGIGAVKYSDLSKDRVSDYVFSWERMLSFDGNTAPYLQNAYVRIQAIFRKAGGKPATLSSIELKAQNELSLAKHLLRFGDVIELVARELKPHHLTTYLYELATRFHAFYEHCPVIKSEEPTRSSRLSLCDLTGRTLGLGLELLGIEHPDQM